MKPEFLACLLLLSALFCLACSSDNGVHKPDGDVADSRGGPEAPVIPDGKRDGDSLSDSDRETGNPWDVRDARDQYLNGDWELGEQPDGGANQDVSLECLKDSDCLGKGMALAPCRKPVCDKHVGLCVGGPKSPGESCDDGDECTEHTSCTLEGACVGQVVVCDDGNICTTDVCKPEEGCIQIHNDNVCDDGNACTLNDRCEMGSCLGEATDECACEDDEDCGPLDDDDLCNGQVKCVFGKCKVPNSTIKECVDTENKPCKKVTCNSETGECVKSLRENGRPCDDGDACTVGDLCLNGECIGSAPKSCDDGNSCTNDTCDKGSGCLHEYTQYPCDDNDECTVNDHCKFGVCIPGSSNSCNSATCYPKWSLFCDTADVWSTLEDGATNNLLAYSCGGGDMPGPEYTYAFVPPYSGVATVTLAGDIPGLSLFLLESNGTGCDAANCREFSKGVLAFDVFVGRSYFLVVDGAEAEGSGYGIKLECTPHEEYLCANNDDEDKDGLVDCEDPDCKDAPECPEPLCMPIWTLNCGSNDFGSNYGLGATNAVTSYSSIPDNKGCLDNQWQYSGPEFAYRFDAPGSFNVTVRLSGESAQTDLLILRDEGHGCDPVDCIAWGLKKVTFPAEAGETYYMVIDGYSGANGSFDIEVSCPTFVETQCFDGDDNDLDTLTDCEDPDCYQAVECVGNCLPAKTIGCGFAEAFANFGWGSTMAISEYPECSTYVYTGPELAYRFIAPYDTAVEAQLQLETASTDIVVVEGEACDPANCIAYGLDAVSFQAEKGGVYNVIVDGWQIAMGTYKFNLECIPTTEVHCKDGADNDGDGLTDCEDEEDCNLSPDCPKCLAVYPLACGDVDSWSNGSEESTDKLSRYSCHTGYYDGPEFSYLFEPETSGIATLLLTSQKWDLDVLVLGDNGYGCNPANCIAWGASGTTFQVEKGSKYYIVVDGYGKAAKGSAEDFGTGDYTISLDCE